jgi:hypothetical protein
LTASTPGTGTEHDNPLQATLDLAAEDALLREAIGEPETIGLPDGKTVITVPHQSDWPHLASRLAAIGAWDAWAAEVLSEDDQKAFTDAKLHNYQVQRIMDFLSSRGGTTPGKSQQSSSSRRSTRGR